MRHRCVTYSRRLAELAFLLHVPVAASATPATAFSIPSRILIPSFRAAVIAADSGEDFRTKGKAENTNSITTSRDTNVSPQEAYDSILKDSPSSRRRDDGADSEPIKPSLVAAGDLSPVP